MQLVAEVPKQMSMVLRLVLVMSALFMTVSAKTGAAQLGQEVSTESSNELLFLQNLDSHWFSHTQTAAFNGIPDSII